jgi:hypothetical protein
MVSDAFIAEVDNELGPNWSNADKRFVCDAVLRAAVSHLPAHADRSPSEDKKAKQVFDAIIGALILGKGPLHG